MSIPAADFDRVLPGLVAELDRFWSNWPAIRRGLYDHKQGIPAAAYDGTPGGSADPTSKILAQVEALGRDEAGRAQRNGEHYMGLIVTGVQGLRDLYAYQRAGLSALRDDDGAIICVHPARRATKDEQRLAAGDEVDDRWCRSCSRIPDHPPMLAGPDGLCDTCKADLGIARALAGEMGREYKPLLPPVSVTELRADGQKVRREHHARGVMAALNKKKAKK